MSVATVLSWALWGLVLFSIDPDVSGFIGHAAFFLTLFFALIGSFSLLGFGLRMRFVREPVAYRQVAISFRQGTLFSLLLTGALIMQVSEFLRWWNLAAYLILLSLIEFFALAREQKPHDGIRTQ